MPSYVVDPNTLISLPGGGQVSATFLANQGVPGYSIDPASGSVIAPADATAIGLDQNLYPVAQHTDWFPQVTAQQAKPQGQNDAANAQAHLQGVLDQFGLGSLAGWAYGLLVQGYDENYILQELRKRPEFNERFPAIAQRQAAGLPPISPAEYVSAEKGFDQLMHSTGLDGFFDRKSLYTSWISGDVSPSEAKARADAAYSAAMGEPIETRQELTRLFGAAAGPAAIAYYLDPTNTLPKLQQQLKAGEIAGAAVRTTYGLLTADEANKLASEGISNGQAIQGFNDLATKQQLFQGLPGQEQFNLTQDQQIGAEFEGNAQTQQELQRIADQRKAEFAGSSGYRVSSQGGQTGLVGAGSANT